MRADLAALEPLFRALSNETRLSVVDRLSRGPTPVSELAEPFDMALPSFMQHLEVLEECGLVRSEKVGRVRTCRLVGAPLREVESWMAERRAAWESRLDRFDAYVHALKKERER